MLNEPTQCFSLTDPKGWWRASRSCRPSQTALQALRRLLVSKICTLVPSSPAQNAVLSLSATQPVQNVTLCVGNDNSEKGSFWKIQKWARHAVLWLRLTASGQIEPFCSFPHNCSHFGMSLMCKNMQWLWTEIAPAFRVNSLKMSHCQVCQCFHVQKRVIV